MSRIYKMSFASVYTLYIAKVERKGRTQAEVDQVILWLTGFTKSEFIPKLDHENTDYGWFGKDDLPSPLFPTLIDKINKIWEN